jgi:MtN3 and saliva related transmembrane protein
MFEFSPYIGGIAALLASLSYIPQVRIGLAMWIVYGALRGDWVIVSANAMGFTLAAIVLGCKIRDRE